LRGLFGEYYLLNINSKRRRRKLLKMNQPEHMDKWVRNKRLYNILKEMGLFVEPVYSKTNRIDYFKVSTGAIN